jgi:chromate transporter
MTHGSATPWAIFGVFLKIGLSSFGGGTTTMTLMQRELVQRRGWITAEQFALSAGLSNITPGINLLAQTILIGRWLAGWPGLLGGLLGLLVPAAVITVLLSVVFVAVSHAPLAVAALHGVIPATAGMTLAMAVGLWPRAVPAPSEPLAGQRRRRVYDTLCEMAIALSAFALLFALHIQAPVVLGLAALAGALCWRKT